MIKFRIYPQNLGGGEVSIWESLGKCQNYSFFDIFLDILHKVKDNLGHERVKRGFYPSRATLEQFPLIPLEKIQFFSILSLLFRLSRPKIWLTHLDKSYIFEISNNRAIPYKSFIMLSLGL